ncbi:hypothetical protein J2793_004529 [Paraburkholderia caledonica]|uniref:Uncharacterized protein n=1 Tax=Paraburkholderia caledonica TaxID=134536 RepID=A0AB73IGC2_9BURK|nr:hypothetical protein [Paraburkholderia caledonica]
MEATGADALTAAVSAFAALLRPGALLAAFVAAFVPAFVAIFFAAFFAVVFRAITFFAADFFTAAVLAVTDCAPAFAFFATTFFAAAFLLTTPLVAADFALPAVFWLAAPDAGVALLSIRNLVRSLTDASHAGAGPRPLHVAPVVG